MATSETLAKLAKTNPDSLNIHKDVKDLMPEEDAHKLLYAGFIDCSDTDLNQPSFYLNKDWNDKPIPVIVVNEDLDNNFERKSGKVTYSILLNNPDQEIKYQHCNTIEQAIEAYYDLGVFK